MDLLMSAFVNGVAAGVLYGLLAFSFVVLYKATGVANFAQGMVGTVGVFFVWRMKEGGMSTLLAVLAGIVLCVALGVVLYLIVIRPRESAPSNNIIVRTLALSFVLVATVNQLWGLGQPYSFPAILPEGGFEAGVRIPWATLVILAIGGVLVALFVFFFQGTRPGLLARAMAADPEVSRLLGVPFRRLSALMWGVASLLAFAVALLSANELLLSTGMLDGVLLYSFAGAIVFGLTSLTGAILGGLIMGVVNSIVATYTSSEMALIAIFALVVVVMIVRPSGILGTREPQRV